MRIKLIPYQLTFKHPFKIAHTKREFTENLYILIDSEGKQGVGEAVFPPYQIERCSTMIEILNKERVTIQNATKENLNQVLVDLFNRNKMFPACVAAIDTALFELIHVNDLYSVLDLELPKPFVSSYTIGLSSVEEFKKKIIEAESTTEYYKLKIDEVNYRWIFETFKEVTDKKFVIDANQGFKSYEEALNCAQIAKKLGVQYMEQPFVKTDLDSHRRLKNESLLPIIADESFQNIHDLEMVSDCFDGVNIKLMKCGGLLQATEIIKSAKNKRLKTVLGCMSDSIIGIGHAQKIAHLVDWVDLDGHLLNKNNPTRDFLIGNNNLTFS